MGFFHRLRKVTLSPWARVTKVSPISWIIEGMSESYHSLSFITYAIPPTRTGKGLGSRGGNRFQAASTLGRREDPSYSKQSNASAAARRFQVRSRQRSKKIIAPHQRPVTARGSR